MFNYFKQAWNLIKQERLFSAIYIVGTGLAITTVMALSITLYIKFANIYPESNRDRMLVVNGAGELNKNNKGLWASCLSLKAIKACFLPIESAEAVTAMLIPFASRNDAVQPEGKLRDEIPVTVKYIDPRFWTVFPFRFVEGKTFSEAEFNSAMPVAVISRSMAKKLFGSDVGVEGRSVSLNFKQYRISGVVRDASFATHRMYGDLYVPYTIKEKNDHGGGPEGSLGAMQAFILAPSAGEVEKVREETLLRVEQYSSTLRDVTFSIFNQPDTHWKSTFRMGGNHEPDYKSIIIQYALIFLALLLVPAVSLSGMAESRMERRTAEMGVRRAFGAPRGTLIGQIITENFLFTIMGGALGLALSYFLVYFGSGWILQLGANSYYLTPEGIDVAITPAMLFNPTVFGVSLGVCFILNLLSSVIPAWQAARRPIVDSLSFK